MKLINRLFPLVVLLLILILAFLLRSPMFLHGDFYLLPDQGRDLQLVKDIVVNHKIPLIGAHAGIGGLFHGPLWLFMLAPFFLFSHGNPFWTLVPVYIFVSLAIVTGGFLIGWNLYNKYIGLVFAFLLSISQIFISTISYTSNSQVMPFIFLLYLFAFIKFLRGQKIFFPIAFLLIGLGFHFESAFAVFLIPITLIAVYFVQKKPPLKHWLLSVALFLLVISNFIFFDIRHQFLMTHSVMRLATGHVQASKADAKYKDIFIRFGDRVNSLVMTLKSPLYEDNLLNEFLLGLLFISGYIMVFLQRKKAKKSSQENFEIIILSTMLILVFVFYMLYPFSLDEHYFQSLNILAILIFSLFIQKLWKFKLGVLSVCILLLLNSIPVIQFIKQNYLPFPLYNNLSEGTYLNQLSAVDTVYQDANGQPFGYFVYEAPIVTYGMDYLFWWRGKTLYHYLPESQKLPLTYLIMLPPPIGDLHAHDFWIKNTVRTNGKVLEIKQLKGNIIVEKLAISSKEQPANPNYYINLIFR